MIKIAPSILSADFARLGAEVEDIRIGGADYVHFDVMDGCFVPNISIGIPVLKSLRKATELFIDVHLMIREPVRYAEAFCRAGRILSTSMLRRTARRILRPLLRLPESWGRKQVSR